MNKVFRYTLAKIRAFVIFGVIAICVYFVSRVIVFSISDYSPVERFFGVLLLVGELYMLVHAMGYILSVFKVSYKEKEYPVKIFNARNAPSVAVVVAERHEPKTVLEDTITTLTNLDYPNKNIYLLDDSTGETYKKEADEIGKRYGIKVYRREIRHGAKAGIENDFMKDVLKEKYIAVFDADQNPMPDFLNKTISIMESDGQLGFVQTPQVYTNTGASPIARAAGMQQNIFYENICEGKSLNNAMFCCGTNVVFRSRALIDVGGFDESSITEDFATSIRLHLKGYKSLYYNHVCAFGMAPESLPAYFIQQSRWAGGTIGMFIKMIKLFFKYPFKLSFLQWWEYFLAGTFYFVGWAFFFMMICPIVFLLFNIPSFFLKPEIYITAFVPYILISLLIFYSTLGERNYRFKDIYIGTILGLLSFPVLMKVAVYGVLGRKMPFGITTKGKAVKLPFLSLWPYLGMISLNLSAVVNGFLRLSRGNNRYAVSVNMIWATYHLFILFHIFYLNKIPVNKPAEAK